MPNYLHHGVNTVFVMLGQRCNFSCRYCLQHPLMEGNKIERPMDPDLIGFLQSIASRQDNPLGIHFYGGEPFLYKEAMREIVEALRCEPNFRFSAISNGSLIDEAAVDWCNENGVGVGVSWDGPGSTLTRGKDVFANKDSRARLLRLQQMGISAVISAYCYPLEMIDAFAELDREYYALHGYNLNCNFDEIMDTGLADRSLLAVDLERVNHDMEVISGEYEKALRGQEHDPWRANMGSNYVNILANTVKNANSFERGTCACGNGITTLNVDLRGNLYPCHNTDKIIGTMHDPFSRYVSQVILNDTTRENSRVCKDCPVVAICNAGCPLIGQKVREATYCPLKRAMFQPVVDLVRRIGGIQTESRNR